MTANSGKGCGQWETWDYCALDVDRLRGRATLYAQKAGAKPETIGAARSVLYRYYLSDSLSSNVQTACRGVGLDAHKQSGQETSFANPASAIWFSD